MNITIDATSTLLRSAGVKSYIYHWVRALRASSGRDQIRAFPYLGDLTDLDHEGSTLGVKGTMARLALVHALNLFGAPLLDVAISDSDVFHASNLVRCAPRRAKLTATLHDLTCWLMPELHTPANVKADALFAERVLKKADGLIAVSENTRQDAIRLLGIAPEKITTIYSGVAEEYFDAAPTPRQRPYVLYVGTIEPRKNLDALLDAWAQLKPDLRHEFDFLVVGPRGWASDATFARVQKEATYLGYVPEEQMPGLFAGATLFVYPSLYEGFGFPVAQAMAAHVAVVTSQTSALPEVARDAAVLVDPHSTAEIAAGITRLLESEPERAKLARYGRARAEKYRWERCAEESLRFFHRVAGII
jgi:glycosyltransferase involved in cell wall biosynthesis